MKLKYITTLVLIVSLASIIYGFIIKEEQVAFAHKCIGLGTVGIFLIVMPLFLIKESKGKKVKDYMLTEENILKMQGKKPKKTDNQ
ncbi:hypothetical protein I2486_08850 [Cellulophaga sp. E16_2]|uniref:Isoleucyl-tRNA synthetase n=1 Tax=Cellulophaga algicola (strain DSM 14237 / IC166 / ACAM 630) TaxID=688270 RepID=E6XCS4_CELAD|nr:MULTISPECIES: hypothetical protein [Cellulophaga]ADV49063.1 hypothetical protein Celal_1762 [Cellulophaga algicola DSM 14237]MBO0591516.1 hypothetical protein [Cellulophaga sp. E16_2]